MTNNASLNIAEHMSLQYNQTSFGYTPKSGIAGSCGKLFSNFLRSHHTDFQSGLPVYTHIQQWRSVPFTPQPLQHKL